MILLHRMRAAIFNRYGPVQSFGGLCMTYHYYFFYLSLLICCLFWVINPLGEYLTGDATCFILFVYKVLDQSQPNLANLMQNYGILHPFLYPGILILIGKLFGVQLIGFRLFGVVCLLINLYLLRKIAHLMVENQRDGRVLTLLSYTLFLLIPYTIDGALHIDIDNTIILPIILFFVYFFAQVQVTSDGLRRKYILLTCIVLFLGFWAKLTTPLLLPISVGVFYMLKRKPLIAVIYPVGLVLIGGGFFLLTWFLFCTYFELPFSFIFEKIVKIFLNRGASSLTTDLREYIRQLSLIVFAFNPLIILSWLVSFVFMCRNYYHKKKINNTLLFVSILSIMIFVGYIIVGQTTYGVPKYHYPLTAMMALILAYHFYPLFNRLVVKQWGLPILLFMIFCIFYYKIGDPLYLINYSLKIQAMNGLSFHPVLVKLWIIVLAYFLPLLILMIWLTNTTKKGMVFIVLFVVILAQMTGLNFRQSFADYHVSYSYGYRGAADIYKYIPKSGRLFFPENIIIPPVKSVGGYDIDNMKSCNLKEWQLYVNERNPDAVIYGPALNTISQMKGLFLQPQFEQFMDINYVSVLKGDYNLYLKKRILHDYN